MRRSAVAGTFNVLHDGHKELIRKAFEVGDEVFIGVTSDEMAARYRADTVPMYIRMSELRKYLYSMNKPWTVSRIDDVYGPRDRMDQMDVLVVSEETFDNGKIINEDRKKRGIKPLELCVIPLVMSYDGSKISSSGILKGEYGRNGLRDIMDISVGSMNRVKTEAVRTVMEKIYGNVRITAVDVDSGVPPQPFEDDTRRGAVNRAGNALGSHDMAVGIEAGVFEKPDGLYDYQYCAITDRSGRTTIGTGLGFRYPDGIAELVRNGMTVGDAVHSIYGDTDIGRKQGAIGLLSKGLIDRKALTEQSVTAAMIPRIYGEQDMR